MNEKYQFCLIAIAILAVLQVVAWILGYDGVVFAFTSGCIGAIIGFAIGKLNIPNTQNGDK